MSKKTLSLEEKLKITYAEFEKGTYSDSYAMSNDDSNEISNSLTDEMRGRLNMQNITSVSGEAAFLQPYTKFNRFYNIFDENELNSVTSYVFITRPDCNISADPSDSNYTADQFWVNAGRNKNMLNLLTSNTISPNHHFLSFLTDRAESLQIPDVSLKQFNTQQPLSGWTINYAGNANESLSGGTIDVTFRDDVELRVTKLIENWVMYTDKVVKGEITPKQKYIWYKIFDYMSSMYYFVCDATASRILYYSKFTGIFPINVPVSAWSHNLHGTIDSKINVTFAYSLLEHNSFDILRDFNFNSGMGWRADAHPSKFINTNYVPNYNPADMSMLSVVGSPFVAFESSTGALYLRWNEA